MAITFSAPVISNITQLGGNQRGALTAGLGNGGYVVAWESDVGGVLNVNFQRFDAQGVRVGAADQIANTFNRDMVLRDIAVADDGTFSILTEGSVGAAFADRRLFVSSFVDTTGGPSGPVAALNLTAFSATGISGAQLVPDASSLSTTLIVTASVVDIVSGQDLVRATVSTAGAVLGAPTVVTQNFSGSGITELIQGVGSDLVAIAPTTLVDTAGTFAAVTGAADAITIEPGNFVVARNSTGSAQITLSMFTGVTTGIGGYNVTGGFTSTTAPGLTTAGAQSFDVELVNLGDGRIMIVWVADGGDSVPSGVPLGDGVYAQVFSVAGGPEGSAVQIRTFGTGSNDAALQSIGISADLMKDGRVAVGLSFDNGLTGRDVFSTILDGRVAGITLTATAGADKFVGTAFDDTFTGATDGDSIIGGGGVDTVVFTGATARSIDLDAPQNFPATTLSLTGIENLTGGTGNDDLRGNTAANTLLGGVGNDALQGRAGADTLAGGTQDDLLRGDAGEDLLRGDDGNDSVLGGTENDLLFGGIGDDRLRGDLGDDTVNGDAGNDRVIAGAGADSLTGGDGNDVLDGDSGDDVLFGGAGDDIIRGDAGSDQLFGGANTDALRALTSAQLVDGGSGFDTLIIADTGFAPGTGGVHLDLTEDFDLFGLADDFTRFGATISLIENVTGTAGDDFIAGDGAGNLLRGGKGDDILFGRSGNDTLAGNAGADGFIFNGATGGADRISDFEMALDTLFLVQGSFGDIHAGNIAARLTVNATGSVGAIAAAQFTFDNAGTGFGTLSFDADGNGIGAAVILAVLVPTTGDLVALTAADFAFL